MNEICWNRKYNSPKMISTIIQFPCEDTFPSNPWPSNSDKSTISSDYKKCELEWPKCVVFSHLCVCSIIFKKKVSNIFWVFETQYLST